jgi:hypothetical protein
MIDAPVTLAVTISAELLLGARGSQRNERTGKKDEGERWRYIVVGRRCCRGVLQRMQLCRRMGGGRMEGLSIIISGDVVVQGQN